MHKSTPASPWITKPSELRHFKRQMTRIEGFAEASNQVMDEFKSRDNLPILHIRPESHPDHLLRLHLLLRAVLPEKTLVNQAGGGPMQIVSAGAVIIVDSATSDNHGFKQACWVVSEHSNLTEQLIFGGAGFLFDNVAVIRGVTDKHSTSNAVARVENTVKNLIRRTQCNGLIWHECATIFLLNQMIQDMKQWRSTFKSNPLKAVSITGGLTMGISDGALRIPPRPVLPDKATTEAFFGKMKSMKIPVVLVDDYLLGIRTDLNKATSPTKVAQWYSHSTALPLFTSAWPFLIPPAASEPVLKEYMEDLALNIYRLYGRLTDKTTSAVTGEIKGDFSATKAKFWAKNIIHDDEFTKEKNSRPIAEHLIKAFLNADAPVSFDLDAMAGSLLDPARDMDTVTAMRVEMDWSAPQFRARLDDDSTTYILVSKNSQSTVDTMFAHWQKVMQHVLPPGRVPTIEKDLAGTWLYMAGVLVRRMEYMKKKDGFKKWDKKDRETLESIKWCLQNGGMSMAATRALNMTPKEFWKQKGI